ncbi:MAG: putative metal-binding motif-containing protein [Myxococcales bacterium]|nr:putative metal-binding motif-containing protein [Myxococcales bacterium]
MRFHLLFAFAPVACGDALPCEIRFVDLDADGFGDLFRPVEVCPGDVDDGLTPRGGDCDDTDPLVHPDAIEVCDTLRVDEDCDGDANADDDSAADVFVVFVDADGDGLGDRQAGPVRTCNLLAGHVFNDADCDDGDPFVGFGVAVLEGGYGCYQDADGDGYGATEPDSAAAQPGSDCDDFDARTFRHALESDLGDIDRNCDDLIIDEIREDFETGDLTEVVFPAFDPSRAYDISDTKGGGVASSGRYSMELPFFGNMNSHLLSLAHSCTTLTWSFDVHRGQDDPSTSDELRFEAVGSTIQRLVTVDGSGTDQAFRTLRGSNLNPALYSTTFFRWVVVGASPTERFYVDDVELACRGVDLDADGYGTNEDCDDLDPQQWSSCASCVDVDGDGYGQDCDLGPDCDDDDATVSPAAIDDLRDGSDVDCDGIDGPTLQDSFEAGIPDPNTWLTLFGGHSYAIDRAATGARSLLLTGGAAMSTPRDFSVCTDVEYSMQLARSAPAPSSKETFEISFWDGSAWVVAQTIPGTGAEDADFTALSGVLVGADHDAFELQLRALGTGAFSVDDVVVACGDGDGIPEPADCAPADPDIFPGQVDVDGDGIDSDCDGFDS